MKNSFVGLSLIIASMYLIGCSTSQHNGILTGSYNRGSWAPETPYGMVYVPSGRVFIGLGGDDALNRTDQTRKSVTIQGFYMDATEITNNEYRQFIDVVKEERIRESLGYFKTDAEGNSTDELDWAIPIDLSDPEVSAVNESFYYDEDESLFGYKDINPEKLKYEYTWFDIQQMVLDKNEANKADYVKKKQVEIHPDVLVWQKDFTFSYNEPMTRNYFRHPAFDNYPVVGIDWYQASAFSNWRTKFFKEFQPNGEYKLVDDFRLPTEHEWEYAAKGGVSLAKFPWEGAYVRNEKGCMLANFKPGRGNYYSDGGIYTVRADSYWPNGYGLYNMAGNVSEWTSSAYYEEAYSFIQELNPDIKYTSKEGDALVNTRKVTRGGSWKDIAYYIQTGARDWEYGNNAKSHIGFRCVTSALDFASQGAASN